MEEFTQHFERPDFLSDPTTYHALGTAKLSHSMNPSTTSCKKDLKSRRTARASQHTLTHDAGYTAGGPAQFSQRSSATKEQPRASRIATTPTILLRRVTHPLRVDQQDPVPFSLHSRNQQLDRHSFPAPQLPRAVAIRQRALATPSTQSLVPLESVVQLVTADPTRRKEYDFASELNRMPNSCGVLTKHQGALLRIYGQELASRTPAESRHGLRPRSRRPSQDIWRPLTDAYLVHARRQGESWSDIAAAYPSKKTAESCRRRHQRLLILSGLRWSVKSANKTWEGHVGKIMRPPAQSVHYTISRDADWANLDAPEEENEDLAYIFDGMLRAVKRKIFTEHRELSHHVAYEILDKEIDAWSPSAVPEEFDQFRQALKDYQRQLLMLVDGQESTEFQARGSDEFAGSRT